MNDFEKRVRGKAFQNGVLVVGVLALMVGVPTALVFALYWLMLRSPLLFLGLGSFVVVGASACLAYHSLVKEARKELMAEEQDKFQPVPYESRRADS